jgi:uncharacterized OsmC-like protein
MSIEQTIEALKKDNTKGERKFNIRVEDAGPVSFKISMGEKPDVVITDSPAGLGGQDKGPSPLLLTLAAIGSCIGTVIKFWAKLMKLKLDNVDISMRGDINLCGIFGIGNHKAAFSNLKPVVRISTSEPENKINELLKNVDEHCPAFFLIRDANPIEWDIKIKK